VTDAPASPALPLLLEDGPLLVFDKPAGIPTQTSHAGAHSVENLARDYLRANYEKKGKVYLGIPHRLDRPVSGAICFARNSKAAARLSEEFEKRQVKKIYLALLEGRLPQTKGMLVDRVRKLPGEARSEIVPDDVEAGDAKEARLLYRVRRIFETAAGEPRTLAEIELVTGRMHQIRLQFSSRGFPVVGDTQYGGKTPLPPRLPDDERSRPILLHAESLQLLHPVRYDPVAVSAPLPHWWNEWLPDEPE
jgi:23S rRNA pseudouridine1911/1915/1917 synthase